MYSLKLLSCSDVIHDAMASISDITVNILPKLLTLLSYLHDGKYKGILPCYQNAIVTIIFKNFLN